MSDQDLSAVTEETDDTAAKAVTDNYEPEETGGEPAEEEYDEASPRNDGETPDQAEASGEELLTEEEWEALGEDDEDDEERLRKEARREKERNERAARREKQARKEQRRMEKEQKAAAKIALRAHRRDGKVGTPGTEMPAVRFVNVSKDYENIGDDENQALDDVSFEIQKGEFVFIVGPSGSGKSTIIRLMMKEISPTDGTIFMAGRDLSHLAKKQVCKYRREIGIVFQDFRLLTDRNVYENVAFAQQVIGQPKRKIPREVAKMLALVGLSNKYKKRPNELSGGEQQRVALARALVNKPTILLADEPTGNLDPVNSREIMSLLEEVNRRGTTVVVVTHDTGIVDQLQKRVIKVESGRIVEDKKGGYIFG